jgi:ankyrin repeat protein
MRSIPVVAAAIILAVGLASAPVAADPIHDAAKAGAKVEARDGYGYSPLHDAALSGRADVVEFLLSAGANPKAKNRDGETLFDLVRRSSALKGTDAYWLLNEARYN